MELRYKNAPKKHADGGSVDLITTPVQLGNTLKKVFKSKYGITIGTRYIKTVRGLDGSYYEIDTFKSGDKIPNEVREYLLKVPYASSKNLSEFGISNPEDISYGNIRSDRIAVFGKWWKVWLKSQTKYFEEGGVTGCGCHHFAEGGELINDGFIKAAMKLPKYQDLTLEEAKFLYDKFGDKENLKKTTEGEYYIEVEVTSGHDKLTTTPVGEMLKGLEKKGYGYEIADDFTAKDKLFEFIHAVRMYRDANGSIPSNVMTFAEFKMKKPDVKSPYSGEDEIYKLRYDKLTDRQAYFKGGRKGEKKISDILAYKTYILDTYGIAYDDLNYEERKKLNTIAEKHHHDAGLGSDNFEYLTLTKVDGGLKVALNEEGKARLKEDAMYQNFWEYFEDVQGNSEYMYFDDASEVGLGMTSAPVITDGYYYNDEGKLTDDDRTDAKVYAFMDYQIVSFEQKLAENGEVFFPEVKKYEMGGVTERTRTFVPKNVRLLKNL